MSFFELVQHLVLDSYTGSEGKDFSCSGGFSCSALKIKKKKKRNRALPCPMCNGKKSLILDSQSLSLFFAKAERQASSASGGGVLGKSSPKSSRSGKASSGGGLGPVCRGAVGFCWFQTVSSFFLDTEGLQTGMFQKPVIKGPQSF